MFAKLMFGVALALTAGAMAPSATAGVQWGVSVTVAPPVPMQVATPPPRPGYVWVPGYWGWSGGRHVWMNPSWLRERPGYAYQQPRWVEGDGHWRLERGRWGRGDRDHDGIPNRYDHHGGHPQPQ